MSLHHVKLIHGSGPNRADDRRIGFAIRYVPTYVRQTAGAEDSAMLVRGVDVHHNFLEETPPAADLDEAALAAARGGDRPRRKDPHARHGPGELPLAPRNRPSNVRERKECQIADGAQR